MKLRIVLALALLSSLPLTAGAWGPQAKRAAVSTAFQVMSQSYQNPFQTVDVDYTEDVIHGALASKDILGATVPLGNTREVENAIGTQIQLLREARRMGVGSYFAFRMGVLANLVSEIVQPFAFDSGSVPEDLLGQMETDVDKHLKDFHYPTRRSALEYIRNPSRYFDEALAFDGDARNLIAADYKNGQGYEGYLKKGGPVFFTAAVKSIADAWYTVLLPEGDPTDVKPSPKAVTWYLVDEIEYLLRVRKNVKEADRVYDQFVKSNSGILAAYERIGDAYYSYAGPKGKERGVQEWTAALAYNGPERDSIKKKLSQHYMGEGKRLFEYAASKDAPNDTLQSALSNFTKALEYDQSNDAAAKSINDTQVAITEREQRLKLAIQTVAAGDSVIAQAEKSMVGGDNERAMAMYRQATVVYQQVSDEFKEQSARAGSGKNDASKAINKIINKILDQAQDKLDEGDRLRTDNKYDEAIETYKSVPTALTVVPDDAQNTQGQQKQKLMEEAQSKISDAEREQRQWAEEQKRKAQANKTPAGGAAGGGGAAGTAPRTGAPR